MVSRKNLTCRTFVVPLIVALLLGFGGVSETSVLDGTQWTLVSLHGQRLVENTRITLNFSEGFVNGSAGCNSYRSRPPAMDVSEYITTRLVSDIWHREPVLAKLRRYSRQGRYKATDGGDLWIPALSVTMKACVRLEPNGDASQLAEPKNAIMEQERVYLAALRNATAFRVVDDQLEIDNAAGETTLVFARRDE